MTTRERKASRILRCGFLIVGIALFISLSELVIWCLSGFKLMPDYGTAQWVALLGALVVIIAFLYEKSNI